MTFVFTDIEGSTVRWDRDRAAMQAAVRHHDAIMRTAIAAHAGHVFKTIGDAFCAAFWRPQDAVSAMLDAQRALGAHDFTGVDGLRVRVAIHTGTADERDGDYFGPSVNRVARLLSIAHGGQVLLSSVTSDLVEGWLPLDVGLRDLGEHRLKDLLRPEHVRQLVAPGLPADFPPLRSLATLANNLPLQTTSFLGRETESADIALLLAKHRFVTLTGSGGIGKTRTSLAVAGSAVGGYADGVWFVELAALVDGEYIPTTIAQAVGITLGDGDPLAQLAAMLKSKHLLLVLDNCEHLMEAAARVVSALITTCAKVAVLASSRQALGIVGEATYRMPSLTVPPEPAASGAPAELFAQRALQYPAVALFLDRARLVNNRFELTDANAPIIAEICRRLDGIPLAIELAAARVRILNPPQLRDRLDERFRLLTGGNRDRLPRQQTLRALIDWSHDLLDEREQRLFRRLGIFVNGFTLEAASAICGANDFDEFEVLDILTALVDKSLVMADATNDWVRYSLLESTRAYAAEKLLEAGERDERTGRHLRYYRDLFTGLRRDGDELRPGINDALGRELENVRFALDHGRGPGNLLDGTLLLAAIFTAWREAGLVREGITRLEDYLATGSPQGSALNAKLRAGLAFLHLNAGRYAIAREIALAAVEDARASGDRRTLADALDVATFAFLCARDLATAHEMLEEAEAFAEASPFARSHLMEWRAHLSLETGDLERAERGFSALREQHRERGNRIGEAHYIYQLSDVAFRSGRYTQSANLMREAVALAANQFYLASYGSLLALEGKTDAAIEASLDALAAHARDHADHLVNAMIIETVAYLALQRGDSGDAARLAGYADARSREDGFVRDALPQAIVDRLMPSLCEALTPDELARLTAEGAALTAEAAIALARTLAPIEANAVEAPL